MNVKIVKLIVGEELIGEVTESEDGTTVAIDRPLMIGINHETGRLAFGPYMPYASAMNTAVFAREHVLIVADPVESLVQDYQKATGRLITPPSRIIAPVK